MVVARLFLDCSWCKFVDDLTIQTAIHYVMDSFRANWQVTLECQCFSSALCRFVGRRSSQVCSGEDVKRVKCYEKKLEKKNKFKLGHKDINS